jgi:hypothetical protein
MMLSTAFSVSPSTLTDILASWLNRQAQPAPAPPPYGATAGTVAAPFPLVKITRQYGTQITPGTPHTPPPPPCGTARRPTPHFYHSRAADGSPAGLLRGCVRARGRSSGGGRMPGALAWSAAAASAAAAA